MKWILGILLIASAIYADHSSVDRPNLSLGREENKELLGNIDHKIGDLVNEFAIMKALLIESQEANIILNTINSNLIDFIRLTEKSNELLEHLIWTQDHRIVDIKPKPK